MIVGKRMSHPLLTISPDMPISEAISMMNTEKVRHLVVVEKNKLVGLVTKNVLESALPSKATTLSIYELNYLIDKITVANVMVKDVFTADEAMPVEEAARIMADNKISCLPVLRGQEVVGIITETDLFNIFLELLGARHSGVRFSAEISNELGTIAKLSQAINSVGGDIIAFGTFAGETLSVSEVTVKVQGVDEKKLKQAIEPFITKLLNIRTV